MNLKHHAGLRGKRATADGGKALQRRMSGAPSTATASQPGNGGRRSGRQSQSPSERETCGLSASPSTLPAVATRLRVTRRQARGRSAAVIIGPCPYRSTTAAAVAMAPADVVPIQPTAVIPDNCDMAAPAPPTGRLRHGAGRGAAAGASRRVDAGTFATTLGGLHGPRRRHRPPGLFRPLGGAPDFRIRIRFGTRAASGSSCPASGAYC